MKRRIVFSLLALCLLCGCASRTPVDGSTAASTGTTAASGTTAATEITATSVSVESTTVTTAETATETDVSTTTAHSSVPPKSTTSRRQTSRTTASNTVSTTRTTTTKTKPSTFTGSAQVTVKPISRTEFRGVWVSYIELQDLLHKNNTPEKAAAAIDAVMERCASLKLNTVIWMVRGHSDAYYDSDLFLPNRYAKQLLSAGFDPLAYAVKAAHKRGLSLHAWVNPYRIGADKSYAVCNDYFAYGGKYYYIPTSATARKKILDGIRELVTAYEVDGIHFDDYFYPSGCATEQKAAAFETDAYAAYKKTAGAAAMTPGDWRRNAVNELVSGAYGIVHSREGCELGISPSHDFEKTYGQMFADSKLWLARPGYVDYLCPQVYFGFEHGSAPFDELVTQWLSYPRHARVKLYFGLGLYKVGLSPDRYAHTEEGRTEWQRHGDIMKRSVEYLRRRFACNGMAFYSYTYLDPAAHRSLSSWEEDGETVTQTYDKAVAQQEVDALRSVFK